MIKFFRKIRQNLLNKNKVGKYLLYAFGEIILVIIGILIALNLNKQSEQKQAEAKIDNILVEVMDELENFIEDGKNKIYYYRRMDSLSSIILNTDLTHNDYLDNKNNALWNVPMKKSGLKIDDYAYKALMLNIDVIPIKYDSVLNNLNRLYNSMYATVNEYNEKVSKIVYENNEEISKNYAWYSDPNYKSKDAIAYRLTDFKFRNNVKRYRGINFNHKTAINYARENAKEIYREIAELLNKNIVSKDFIFDYKTLNRYSGTYVNENDPDFYAELFLDDGRFMGIHESKSNDTVYILHLQGEKVFTLYRSSGMVRFDENDLKNDNITIYSGHKATTYTKVNSDN